MREAGGPSPPTTSGVDAPGHRLRVYLSSTLGELASERDAAKSAIKTLRLDPAGADFGSSADNGSGPAVESDIFVAVYWQSYGWVNEGSDVSDLEEEYDRAVSLPRLVYLKDAGAERDERLVALLDRARSDGLVIREFESPGELAELLVDDLAALIADRFASAGSVPGSLPTGTLTFMFGDIAGSTRLVEELGDEYAEVLAGYHDIVSTATGDHQGTVADLEGERVFTVFPDALEAVSAATAIQSAIATRAWPGGGSVRARLGLHTGTARVGSGGYVGLDVHRASRVSSSAHGGQIVISSPVRELVEDSLAGMGWRVKDLGSFALKGLARAERLFQVTGPGLETEFPPPRARSTSRVRLPASTSIMVGREREVAELVELMTRPSVRLVTLTGPGGIGKTRLALAVANDLAASFPDGVFFVNLASLTDPSHVLLAVGEAAGIPIEGEPVEALSGELQGQQVLLLMDNFEHVVGAGTGVTELLARSAGVKVLATSRVPLRLMSEQEYTLEPLALPPPGSDETESVRASDAVRLFMDRAVAVLPGFLLDDENAPPIASIVRIVDGLPLAIELAAARLRMLSPKALSERLTKSLDALGAGAADMPTRQRTLDAAIDWSYQLLTVEEKSLFARLCVFQGGFTVESAQDVAVDEGDVVDLLMALVENSLVLPAHGGEGRLRMLAPMREFGLRKLRESGEYERVKDRHARHYANLAEAAFADLRGINQAAMVERLAEDWNNIDVAADWLIATGDDASLVRLAYGLWVFLWVGNHLRDGSRWLSTIAEPERLDPVQQARCWWLRGGLSYEMGDYEASKVAIDKASLLLEGSGDIDCHNWADFLSALLIPVYGDDPSATYPRLELSLARFRGFGDRWGEGYALIGLGILAASNGDLVRAEQFQLETRQLGEDLGNGALVGLAEAQLGFTYVSSGRVDEARDALRRAFDRFRRMNYREGICYALEAAASLSFAEGKAEMGMVALGAAEEVRERIGLHPWPLIMWLFDSLSLMADSLEDPGLQAARRNGRQMKPFDAAALVLETSPVPA